MKSFTTSSDRIKRKVFANENIPRNGPSNTEPSIFIVIQGKLKQVVLSKGIFK